MSRKKDLNKMAEEVHEELAKWEGDTYRMLRKVTDIPPDNSMKLVKKNRNRLQQGTIDEKNSDGSDKELMVRALDSPENLEYADEWEKYFSEMYQFFQRSMISLGCEPEESSILERISDSFRQIYHISRKYKQMKQQKDKELKVFDFHDWLQDYIDEFCVSLDDEQEAVKFTARELQHCMIMGNRESLAALMKESLTNAIEAGHQQAGIKITLQTVFAETVHILKDAGMTGEFICLKISDRGRGMTESERAMAMQDFFSRNPDCRHSGLGLSLCRSITRLHKGEMELRSRKGRGTQLYYYFPIAAQAEKAEPEIEGILKGSMHILMSNNKLCRHLHLSLAEMDIRANYSTLMSEFIHLNKQYAIFPVLLLLTPEVLNRAGRFELSFMKSLNEEVPFLLTHSGNSRLAGSIAAEFNELHYISYPFTTKDLVEKLKTIKIPWRRRPAGVQKRLQREAEMKKAAKIGPNFRDRT